MGEGRSIGKSSTQFYCPWRMCAWKEATASLAETKTKTVGQDRWKRKEAFPGVMEPLKPQVHSLPAQLCPDYKDEL